MILNTARTTPFYQFPRLAGMDGVLHFVSTRHGGVSLDASASMNLQFTNHDLAERVQVNRDRMARAVGFHPSAFTTAEQVHADAIAVVDAGTAGRGARGREDAIEGVDALVTALPGVCLMVRTADCVPVLLFDPVQRVVAAVHAGWRGSLSRIAELTVRRMRDGFNTRPADVVAGIGPSIGPCCFEIGDEVVEVVRDRGQAAFLRKLGGKSKLHFDLWACNAHQLREAGVSRVEVSGQCTSCLHHEFFSYRRNGVQTGQLGSGILLTR